MHTMHFPDLLETNIRQRGDVGGSAKKVGLRIKELDRLYGIKNGGSGFYGNRHTESLESSNNYKTLKTEDDIAKEIGISISSLQNYKKLTEMIPELSDLVDTRIKRKATGGRSVPVAFCRIIFFLVYLLAFQIVLIVRFRITH